MSKDDDAQEPKWTRKVQKGGAQSRKEGAPKDPVRRDPDGEPPRPTKGKDDLKPKGKRND